LPPAGHARADGLVPVRLAAAILGVAPTAISHWRKWGFVHGEQRRAGSPVWVRLTGEDLARLDGTLAAQGYGRWRLRDGQRILGLTNEQLWEKARRQELIAYRARVADHWEWRISLAQDTHRSATPAVAEYPTVVSVDAEHVCEVGHYETGGREEQHRAWLWTAVTAELTVFQIHRHRGGAAIEALLGDRFAGVVGSDRWSAYSRFAAERRALCHAHLKRDFEALVDRGGQAEPIGRWGLAEIKRLFALWHRFRTGEFDRQKLRRRLIPLQARMGRLLQRGEESPDRKVAGLCRALRKWWPALWTFARVAGV